ncbi:MAG: hypothetical protein GEV28_40775 [Actinophytocola sp.]|uniref:zf-HC2 domain-containing protein n=1 Tax=Actinophytocola sp. TaxID=1872138 RepID=UPI001324D93F|nr:zf-HC2 domain-containing protein [Actinophytocola sp.]MPZ86370.1 hypothetical protein [Actinophytocola sp.]
MTCVNTITLGAYLLGALEPSERYEFEAHLAGCETCRAELIRLAPLPGMLNQISLDDFADDLPPTTFEEVHPTAPLPGPMPLGSLPTPVLAPLPTPPPTPPPGRDVPGGDGPGQEVPIPRLPAFDEPSSPSVIDDLPDSPDTPGAAPRPRRHWLVAVAAAILVAVTVGGVLGWQALDEPPAPVAAGITWSAAASTAGRPPPRGWSTTSGAPRSRSGFTGFPQVGGAT